MSDMDIQSGKRKNKANANVALDDTITAEDELSISSGSADVRDNDAFNSSFSNTNLSDTTAVGSGNYGTETATSDEGPLPIDLPLSAGSLPNSTMEADLGPAPMASMTNIPDVNASTAQTPGTMPDNPPMSEQNLSDVKMPNAGAPAPPLTVPSTEDIKQTASDLAGQAKDKAGQALDMAKDTAGQALSQAKDQVFNQIGQKKDMAVESLDGLHQSVHQFSDTFRQNNLPQLAGYTDTLADQVDRISGYLKNNEPEDLLRDAEVFARQNAGAFLVGAFVLGIAVGRFFRASSKNMAYNGERNALVPYQPRDQFFNAGGGFDDMGRPASSVTGSESRQDINNDDTIAAGKKPMHAQGYVPGGVMGNAPA